MMQADCSQELKEMLPAIILMAVIKTTILQHLEKQHESIID